MPRKTVKCRDCGYLSFVDVESSGGKLNAYFLQHYSSKEVPLRLREPELEMMHYFPIRCHVQKADLDYEIKTYDLPSGGRATFDNPTPGISELEYPGKFEEIIGRDRECDGFTPYAQGLSPDEHRLEARRQAEKHEDRRRTFKDGVYLSILTAVLITVGAVLVKVFWN